MDTNRLLANAVLVAVLCAGSVGSRPNPDLPIVFPEAEIRNHSKPSRPGPDHHPPRPEDDGGGLPATAQRPRFPVRPPGPLCSDPGSTFCEDVPHYPTNEIRQSITYSKDQFREIFGPVELHYRERVTDDDLSEERICDRRTQHFYPKAGKSEDNKWVYVVNDVDYVQAVVAEVCQNENSSCNYVDENLPAGFESKCRQLYAYKRLLALDPSDQKTQMASFRFPSCCVCYIKYPVGWTRRKEQR